MNSISCRFNSFAMLFLCSTEKKTIIIYVANDNNNNKHFNDKFLYHRHTRNNTPKHQNIIIIQFENPTKYSNCE